MSHPTARIRNRARDILEQWQCGTIDELQVICAAEELLESIPDWDNHAMPSEEPKDLIVEVLEFLSDLFVARATTEDIPHLLRLLDAPPGQQCSRWTEWNAYQETIDWDSRDRRWNTIWPPLNCE